MAGPIQTTQHRSRPQKGAGPALCPEADPSCKDPSRQYYVPARTPGGAHEAMHHPGELLDVAMLPELPPEQRSAELRRSPSVSTLRQARAVDRRRGEAYMASVIASLETAAPGGRNDALNRVAWTLGRWNAAGALEQTDVEDELYAAAILNGLVADDGERQCWATIRSGLSAGLQEPIDLDAGRG
jgi:hypothetical protein